MPDQVTDPVHGSGWNTAARWGGWYWREPARGEHFRRCSFCGSIHPENLAAETAGDGICRVCSEHGWEACFRAQPLRLARGELDRLLADPGISDDEKQRLRGEHPAHTYDPGGWWASWADQKYGWPHKFYVDLPNRAPGALFVIGSQSGGQARLDYRPPEPAAGDDGIGWVAWENLTSAQKKIAARDGHRASDTDHSDFYQFGTRSRHHAKFYSVHLADPAISPEVKETIERVSGLRFDFEDGRARWRPYS